MPQQPRTTPGFLRIIRHKSEVPIGVIVFAPEYAILRYKLKTSCRKIPNYNMVRYQAKDSLKHRAVLTNRENFSQIEKLFQLPDLFVLDPIEDVTVDCDMDCYIEDIYKKRINPYYKLPWDDRPPLFRNILENLEAEEAV